MKKLIAVILLFSILLSCRKEKQKEEDYMPVQMSCALTNDLDSCRLLIEGDWNWLELKVFNRIQLKYDYLTPQNQGYTLTASFKKDTVRIFKNGLAATVYRYSIVRLSELSGTDFSEDRLPVLVFYNLHSGKKISHTPIKICAEYLIYQLQFARSIGEDKIWKRQQVQN